MVMDNEQPTGQDQLIAEAVTIQRHKLAETRRIQAQMTPTTTGRSNDRIAPNLTPIGSVIGPIQARIEEIRLQQRAEREQRVTTFLANGGQCPECFDAGPCPACDRGRAVIAEREAQERRDWVTFTGIARRFRDCTFASFPGDRSLAVEVERFVTGWDGRQNLLLSGRYGTGKTGLVAAAVNLLAATWPLAGKRIVFRTAPALFDELRAGFENGGFTAFMRHCQQVDLLIIDDLGAEKPTDWVQERFYAIVNDRYEHERPIWATTNLTPAQLIPAIGERTWSRLQEDAYALVAGGRNLRER